MQYRRRSTWPRQTSPREYSGHPCPMLPARFRHRYAICGQKGPSTSAMSAGQAADASTAASVDSTAASWLLSVASGNSTDQAGAVLLDRPASTGSELVTWLRPQPTKTPTLTLKANTLTNLLDRLPTIRPARHALAVAAHVVDTTTRMRETFGRTELVAYRNSTMRTWKIQDSSEAHRPLAC